MLARAYPRPGHLRGLAERGVGLVINLHRRAHPQGVLVELGMRELHLPVRDFEAPSLEQIRAAVGAFRREMDAGAKLVLVHCGGGFGRTGAVVACLYVREGLTAAEAIERVRAERPGAIETQGQAAIVGRFAAEVDLTL